jgi:DNA-binding transcriptional ArsR family regulator
MKTYYHPSAGEMALPQVLHALSDPVRLIVVSSLARTGEQACGTFAVPVAKSTLSHHLRVLREAGITNAREEGTVHYLSLRRSDLESRFPGVLDAVLASCDETDLLARATSELEPVAE